MSDSGDRIFFFKRAPNPQPYWEQGQIWHMEALSAIAGENLERAIYALPRSGEYMLKAYIAVKGVSPPSGAELESALLSLTREVSGVEKEELLTVAQAYRRLFEMRWLVYDEMKDPQECLHKAQKDLEAIISFVERFYKPKESGEDL